MLVSTQSFGHYQDIEASLFTLRNTQGMQLNLTDYGATITSIKIPDRNGNIDNVVCGFDRLEGYFSDAYLSNSPYFGCTVGRYAARIKDASFSLNGTEFSLAANAGPNHIHGGVAGFDKKKWKAEILTTERSPSVKMKLFSPDMEEGYPGNLEVEVIFSLTNKNELIIQYKATTDKATPISLTNHTYFNLSGFRDSILSHTAQVIADEYLSVDETDVPLGEVEHVADSMADLRIPRMIGDAFSELPKGFEHYYLFNKKPDQLTKVAEFQESGSGRTLEILTSEPGMLFYTGYYTSNELQREDGIQYGQYRAFCCETSRHPNGMNFPKVPTACISQPNEPYKSTTIFKFGW